VSERSNALSDDVRQRLLEAARLASVGRLVPSFAHELSTPLAAIALRVESLARTAEEPGGAQSLEKVHRYLQAVREDTERCKVVLRDLHAFARRPDPNPRLLDLNALCEAVARLVRHEAMRRRVELSLALAPGLPTVTGQEGRIAQALVALVLNALDASPAGGQVGLETRAEADGQIAVVVSDEGEGIPAEIEARLGEPFVSSRSPESGSGLALMAARGIAVAHGGTLTWANRPGRGSRFVLRLPVVDGGRSAAGGKADDDAS
jgi:two-component system NtrC family sensor kinase